MSQRTFWDEPRPSSFLCNECGERAADPDDVGVDEQCTKCKADLHCCRNCAYFDTAAENECRQPIEKRFSGKRAKNDCSLFKPVLAVDLRGRAEGRSDDVAKQAFEDLFK